MNKYHKMHKLLVILALFVSFAATAQNTLPDWALGGFQRPEGVNPMISPIAASTFECPMRGRTVNWECADTFNPAAVEKDGKVYVLYRAEDNKDAGIGGRTSRIGYAESADGLHVDYRSPVPVFYPNLTDISKANEWDGGCEDPRVVEATIDGKRLFVMMYTAWNHERARLSVATSTDLMTWTHHGPIFQDAVVGKYCKSGSIVTKVIDGRLQATKVRVQGKEQYLMYWGEYNVFAAVSDDLVHWTPLMDGKNGLLKLANPRPGHFDSTMDECGPPAVITDKGIILIYNGKNNASTGDPDYPDNTYAAGQMLFSLDNPLKVIDRLEKPFFRPMEAFEKTGQFAAGTVFTQGLVYHQGKWFLYYGCADSKVGVAVFDPSTSPREGDPVIIPIAPAPKGVVNQYPPQGVGKVTSTIHSFSGQASVDQGAFYMNSNHSFPGRWREKTNECPWVVYELMDICRIDSLVLYDLDGQEDGFHNTTEYWVSVSTNGTTWRQLAHATNVGAEGVKHISIARPAECRYVKLQVRRAEGDDATRLYGCDIYGEKTRDVSRGANVSTGKTIMKFEGQANEREQAAHLLVGAQDGYRKWCFYSADPAKDPYRYVVIDLEEEYDITSFQLLDSRSVETASDNKNLDTYQVYFSTECPDLSLITPQGDANTCWTLAYEGKNEGNISDKRGTFTPAVRARYVKLWIPRTTSDMNDMKAVKLFGFNLFGKAVTTGVGQMQASSATKCETVYDLLGRPATQETALCIQGGRKYVR